MGRVDSQGRQNWKNILFEMLRERDSFLAFNIRIVDDANLMLGQIRDQALMKVVAGSTDEGLRALMHEVRMFHARACSATFCR